MIAIQKLTGTGVALITPFTRGNRVDFSTLAAHVHFLSDNGIDFLVVLGTTSEYPTLSSTERKDVVRCVLDANKKNLPIVIGIGGNDTERVAEEIKTYEQLFPFDAILSVCPYYNKPNQEGLYRHFVALARVTEKPILLYNVPTRTASNLHWTTTYRLADSCRNIIGIKEATPSMEQLFELCRHRGTRQFLLLSGDDALVYPSLALGFDGVISVIANAFPKEFSTLIRLARNEKFRESQSLFFALYPMIQLIFKEGNPTGIKLLLHLMRGYPNVLRLPLVKGSKALQKEMANELRKLESVILG